MIRRLVVAGALLVGACGEDGLPELADGDVRVVTFNLCGNVCAGGDDRAVPFVADLVEETGAAALLLQEVCRTQADAIAEAIDGVAHHGTTFDGDADGRNRCPDDDYGNAVVTAGPSRDPSIDELPNPGLDGPQIDRRRVLCVETDEHGAFCTTHLVRASNDPEAHAAQVAAVRELLPRLAQRYERFVLGGDFNDELGAVVGDEDPPRVVADGHGSDHVLAATPSYLDVEVVRRSCDCSDHAAVVATLRAG